MTQVTITRRARQPHQHRSVSMDFDGEGKLAMHVDSVAEALAALEARTELRRNGNGGELEFRPSPFRITAEGVSAAEFRPVRVLTVETNLPQHPDDP